MRFSTGTFTSVKRITALASARRPMNWQRCTISTPGMAASTTKAEIFSVSGWRAITTNSSAMVPFVHQSFTPFSTKCLPSGVSW